MPIPACLKRLSGGAIALLALVATADEPARRWKASSGVDYSVGAYGDDADTKILYVPATLRYSAFPWTLKATVPYLQIDGPGDVVGGVDGGGVVVGDGGATATERHSGIGDVVASAMYSLDPWSESAPFVDLAAKAKLPTADEDENLGTGEADYSLQADLARSFGDWQPFVTLGYQFMGSSDELPLDDRPYAAVGTDYRTAARTSVGLVYDWRQAATDTSDDVSEGSVYVNHGWSADWALNVYGVTGFSDGSPDWGLGAQLGRKF